MFKEGDCVYHPEFGQGKVLTHPNGDVLYLGELHVSFDNDPDGHKFRTITLNEVKPASGASN